MSRGRVVRTARSALFAAAALLLVPACAQPVVLDAAPEAPAYDGPLHVEGPAAPTDQDADRGGAAGRVVDCDTTSVGDTASEPYQNSVSASPVAALQRELREPNRGAAVGLREARREADRVLYTLEVDRRVKQATVVHRGTAIGGGTGWYVESWARCDWAELPPELAEHRGLEVWTDADGRRVATSRVASSRGPGHCGWQDMTFLNLDGGDLDGGRTYLENPQDSLYPDYVTVAYAREAPLPVEARDTGYDHGGRHLWLAPDQSRAFVGAPGSVAVWPRTVQPLGCA